MRVSELSVYDWVILEGEAQQVAPSLIDYLFYGQPINIEPMEITTEILEANGFTHKPICGNKMRWSLHTNHVIIWAEQFADHYMFDITTDNYDLRDFHATDVHQLQHALRLGGQTDLADDFKIL